MTIRRRSLWLVLPPIYLLLGAVAASAQSPPAQDARTAGEQLYLQMHQVLSHQRCVNCHPRDDVPRQTDAARVHVPPIARGAKGEGPAGLQCNACHQEANNAASGVPGAPHWHLAPRSMGWQGLSAGELCRALVDRKRNGNRSVEAIVQHLTSDPLVLWGWAPGTDASGNPRTAVPIAKPQFDQIVRDWAKLGAVCPK